MALKLDRQTTIAAIFVMVALVILGKLFYIQILNPDYKLSADNNVLRRITQYPARGTVYDRKQRLLVYNEAAYDIMVVPNEVKPFDTAAFLELFGITREYLDEQLQAAKEFSSRKESLFLKQLSTADFAKVQEYLYQYPGFYAQPRTLRHYPQPIAAHLLGYVGALCSSSPTTSQGITSA